jgi:protein-S-isoprenylcysteine O-methyltransferase Ste14
MPPTLTIHASEAGVTSSSPSASGASASGLHRALVLSYGVVVYGLFLATFLYAIGFVSGALVPKGMNDGAAPASVLSAILVNAGILALFAIQHTIMARPAFKARWTRVIPAAAERSTFVLATCAILGLLFWQWQPLDGVVWHLTGAPAVALWAVAALGWGLVLVATFLIDHFDLFGLRQVVLHARGIRYTHPEFQERWLYKLVRHPLLLGFLIAFWSTPHMTWGHLLFAGVTTLYIFILGTVVEERDLVSEHGDAYRAYQRRVPKLIPFLKRAG